MNRYKYQVLEGNTIVFEGTSKEVKEKYYISSLSSYTDKGNKMLGKYKVIKSPYKFVPTNRNEEYYYYSLLTDRVQKDYWNEEDTNCIMRFECGNVFETRSMAETFGKDIMYEIFNKYKRVKNDKIGC